MVEAKDFLEYLTTWRSSKEIVAHFGLSNTEFYNMKKWCLKGNYIETYSCGGIEPGKTNRTYLYKAL